MGPIAATAGTTVVNDELERHFQRQMGCMAGFLQIFDRHQILAGKRIYAAKRLPSSPVAGSRSPSEISDTSAASFAIYSPEQCPSSPVDEYPVATKARPRPPLPLPVFDFKEGMRSTWKLKEAPRLSLDSRAIVDGKGKLRPRDIRTVAPPPASPAAAAAAAEDDNQRRSPSVVARLMGLEALPDSAGGGVGADTAKLPQLRRSASESRVTRDLSRVLDPVAYNKPPLPPMGNAPAPPTHLRKNSTPVVAKTPSAAPPAQPAQHRSFFEDFYPEPKPTNGYGEIERRLRLCGIDEPASGPSAAAQDLETLKQVLEAVQLRGLLHSRPYDHHQKVHRSPNPPIVVMKPTSKPPRRPSHMQSPPPPAQPQVRPLNERRRPVSPAGSPARRRPVSPEPPRQAQPQQRRMNNNVQSPRASPRRSTTPDQTAVRSPRNRRSTGEISSRVDDDASSISESSFSASSHLDFERPRVEYKEGRNLLERCDKLLSSIAAFTSPDQVAAIDQQPSPISVLDSSSFLGSEDNNSPPLAVSKRSLHFKDQVEADLEDRWELTISSIRWKIGEEPDPEDPDFIYVSDIVRASDRHRELDSDFFLALEKRHHLSPSSQLHRRLLFDAVAEAVDCRRHVSPWEAFVSEGGCAGNLLRGVWIELRRAKVQAAAADDLNDITGDAITKDMATDGNWEVPAAELSDAVLYIERQLFKDLIGDTIRELAEVAASWKHRVVRRRKLVF